VSTTSDDTRKQGDVEISDFPISVRDGLVIDVSFVCEFKGSNCAPGGWNGVRHSNHVLQARTKVKNNKYKDVYGHKAFAPAIVGMFGQIHADFLRLLWVLADKQLWHYYESMDKKDKIGSETFRLARTKVFNYNKTSVGRTMDHPLSFVCAQSCDASLRC